jgi:HD-GYP domain-containing protein (c-di-GMP phosphodiesterase class II)
VSEARPRDISVSHALKAEVRKYGRAIICNLSICLKTARLYSLKHQFVLLGLNELESFLKSFVQLEGDCRLSQRDDGILLNDVRIKVDFGSAQSHQFMLELLKAREIGEFTFSPGFTRRELESLLEILNAAQAAPEEPWESFEARLAGYDLPNVQMAREQEHQEEERQATDGGRAISLGVYFEAIAAMDELLAAAQSAKPLNLRRIKKAVHVMVDMILNEEHLLVALTNIKDRGAPGSNHAVNVSILAVALGAKMGLSKKLLGDLGVAALLHDIGKADRPPPPRSASPGETATREPADLRDHVYRGAERLLKEKAVGSLVKGINVAFLHHYGYDQTGYPRLIKSKEQNLFTRVVAAANHYDNATTPGRLHAEARSPEAVLREMMSQGGTSFDPLVVKAFINLLGLYPVGCMVTLDSREVGTVIAPATDPKFLDRPTVKIILDADGHPTSRAVHLMERDGGGSFLRTIIKIYQQEEIQLDLKDYLSVL